MSKQLNVNSPPQVARRGNARDERSVVCTATATRTPRHQQTYPIELAADISSRKDVLRIGAATAVDIFDGGRRRKRGILHQSTIYGFFMINLRPFRNDVTSTKHAIKSFIARGRIQSMASIASCDRLTDAVTSSMAGVFDDRRLYQ